MKPTLPWAILLLLGIALLAFLGGRVIREAPDPHGASRGQAPGWQPNGGTGKAPRSGPPPRLADPGTNADSADPAGPMKERILVFRDAEAMDRFLARLGNHGTALGRIDALHALRVALPDGFDINPEDGAEEAENFPLRIPDPPDGKIQPGAVPLGTKLREWLGIEGDSSRWGRGVTVAVLDTGVEQHPAFSNAVKRINLLAANGDTPDANGHGTAVASVVAGSTADAPGVAPAADILSVRIADAAGRSNSFLLAQGIIAAADAGADIINVSMAGFGESSLVGEAVGYAASKGALIVAAAGNNGLGTVSFPAGHNGVIAVGAVDALGNHLDFSNAGDSLDVSAPGHGLQVAWTEGTSASMSGTSFSAPVIAGAVAAVMTESGTTRLTPAEAWKRIAQRLNDTGTAGADPLYGAGLPDLGRVIGAKRGTYDAALASQRILDPSLTHPDGQVELLVQNRGTEPLANTVVEVRIGERTTNAATGTLAPNAVRTLRVPLWGGIPASGTLRIDSSVKPPAGITDAKPSNDSKAVQYRRNTRGN
jgi:hypothetical protein